MIGKLRAIFVNAGLGGEWDDRLGIGNPVSHPSIKQYLKSIKEEQAKARSRPKKAIPIFLDKLEKLAVYIFAQLSAPHILPINLYSFSRDLCFFTLDFFSGDRSSDLGRIMLKEVLFFPTNRGFYLGRALGKP
jgi:integrase